MSAAVNTPGYGIEQNNYVDVLLTSFENQKTNLVDLFNCVSATSAANLSLIQNFGTKFPDLDKALHLLNVQFWGEVYSRSNIATFLDSKKREQWSNDLYVSADNKANLPDFTRENILATLKTWYESREELFVDRVELVFQSLSHNHVTNEPQGFSRKMIFSYSACEPTFNMPEFMNISYGVRDILFDLANVIATVLKLPAPSHNLKDGFSRLETKKTHSFLGNTFELQVFKNGNIHVWIHPYIAVELNLWLAKKYPAAIASKNREKPKKTKEFFYNHDYLTESDYRLLSNIQSGRSMHYFTLTSPENRANGNIAAAERFSKFTGLPVGSISFLGAGNTFMKVAQSILRNGYPNIKDHQFYPTPEPITESIKEHLTNKYSNLEDMLMLEPSAGTGSLAMIHPHYPIKSNCVEISEIFCQVLKAKGIYTVENTDFMKFKSEPKYDIVVMNPPYKQKQLESHLSKALTHLKPGGELIAVIPKGKVNAIKLINGFESLNLIACPGAVFEDTKIETAVISVLK